MGGRLTNLRIFTAVIGSCLALCIVGLVLIDQRRRRSAMSLKAQVLRSKFLKRGGVGRFTYPFEQAAMALREAVLDRAQLGDGEEPVLLSTSSPGDWVLLTTTRVLSITAGEIRSFA